MPPVMTEAQDRAFQVLNDRYGDCRRADDPADYPPGTVRLEGVDGDGGVRARWTVHPEGYVLAAWDPDYLLDAYTTARQG